MEVAPLRALRERFGAALDAAGDRPLFERIEWFEMLARHCFADRTILPACADNPAGDVALLPLVQDGCELHSLSNYYSFSYAPLFLGGDERPDHLRLLTQIARDLRRQRFGKVSLFPLFAEDGAMPLLRDAFRAGGWVTVTQDVAHNHRLDLRDHDFAAYWAARPGALRKKVRKMRNAPLAYEIHERIDDDIWRDYLTVYAASWKKREPFPQLLRSMAEMAAREGNLRLGIVRLDGQAIAVQLWIIDGDTAQLHKVAHDSHFDKWSPGTMLTHHMMQAIFANPAVGWIDYGTGDNAYKRDWMNVERPMYRLLAFNPAIPGQWMPALKTCISAIVANRNRR